MPDLNWNVNATVTGRDEVSGLRDDLKEISEVDAVVSVEGAAETATALGDIEESTAADTIGEVGEAAGTATTNVSGLATGFGEMVAAIGLVNIATFGADFVMGKFAERQEKIANIKAFDDAQVIAFADAIRKAGDDVSNLVDALEETQRITGIDMLSGEVVDITNDLAAAGVTADQYFHVLQGGGDSVGAFIQGLEDAGVAEETRNRIQIVAIDNLKNIEEGNINAAGSVAVFAESQASANEALQGLLNQQDPMRSFTSEWDLLKESMADGSIDTTAAADALNTLRDGLGLTTEQVLELAQADLNQLAEGALAFASAINSVDFRESDLVGATTAFAAYTDGLFAAGNEAAARESAFDALSASAEDQALTFSAATDAGRAQQAALEGVARVIDTDLTEAYDNANGSQADFIAAATQIGDETLARLQSELGLTTPQVEALRNVLGLTEDDYKARFDLAGTEEARIQLDLLSGAIDALPPDVSQTVTQQIIAGDFVGARDTVANYYVEHPVPVPTEVDASGAVLGLADATANPPTATIPAEADTIQAAADLLAAAAEPRSALIVAVANNEGAFNALESLRSFPRVATIDTEAETAAAEGELETAARARTSTVTADAHTAGAEAELNNAARDRYSTIHVRTVGGGFGGGGGPTFGAGPGPGPLGAGPLGADEAPVAAPTAFTPSAIVAEPTTEISVTINAGVIGNGFDVERAVYSAVQDAVRFRGQRRVLTVGGRNP